MVRHKKGSGLQWYLLILAFVFGIMAYYVDFYFLPHRIIGNYIGQHQFSLLKAGNEAEKALLYSKRSAEFSAYQTIYELANNMGYYEESECGAFQGTNVIASIEKEKEGTKIKGCYLTDDKIKKNFKENFDEQLNNYLANYPDANIPGFYNYELKGRLEIIGRSEENLVIEILPENFVVKPAITATKPSEIYQQVVKGETPTKLNVPMKSNPDIEAIKTFHPEVWNQYVELCRRMGASPGICAKTPTKCCITSGYRHPSYNKKEGGARNSAHQYGVALDIYVGKDKLEQLKWANAATEEEPKLFTRVGIYPGSTHIHVDLMPPSGEFAAKYWIGAKGKTISTASNFNELENKAKTIGIA
ncbi:MAG: D-Ala-D-Ala carboxypeptidase family metallohydrolase [Nanoarchaeota archaeon]